MAKLLDANAILRFLLNDIPEQANKTAEIIFTGAFTREIVISEVVYVLEGFYDYSRVQIAGELNRLLELVSIENSEVIQYALKVFGETSLDFVDCVLIGYNQVADIAIFSFDKKLNSKLKGHFPQSP